MLRGIYTAASGMLNTQLAVDTMANNVANVNTTGFKARYVQYQAYPEIQMSRIDDNGSQEIGKLTTGVEIIGTPLHFSQGHLQQLQHQYFLQLQCLMPSWLIFVLHQCLLCFELIFLKLVLIDHLQHR